MKRATAIQRLEDVAEGLESASRWRPPTVTAAYALGALLDGPAALERVEIALVVDEPPEVVPWLARPARLEALAASLCFTKLPLQWRWRPAVWPVWNHAITRAVRFWTTGSGRDDDVLEELRAGRVDDARVASAPSSEALAAQLQIEYEVSRRHLAEVTQSFYDRDWRRGSAREQRPGDDTCEGEPRRVPEKRLPHSTITHEPPGEVARGTNEHNADGADSATRCTVP